MLLLRNGALLHLPGRAGSRRAQPKAWRGGRTHRRTRRDAAELLLPAGDVLLRYGEKEQPLQSPESSPSRAPC